MIAVAETTISEKILLAAHALEESGRTPFSAESLIVSVWKLYPETFGLKEFTHQYPDSNKVLVGLMGARGLASRGWLAKLGRKQYSLTRDGRLMVRRLQGGEEPPRERKASTTIPLSRDQDRFLHGLLSSSAWLKAFEDRRAELTFADACRYWSITENLSGNDLDQRLQIFRRDLTGVERLLGSNGKAVLTGGRSISGDDIADLDKLHTYLEQRFGRHLALLRSRTTKV